MSTIELKPVSKNNWQSVVRLKVHDSQAGFVASNAYSLAEAAYEEKLYPLAVYDGSQLVGFVMLAVWDDLRSHWVLRLMIDREYQGKGYGRAALLKALERLQQFPECQAVYISFEPENDVAKKLYTSLGFTPTGELIENEVVYRLDLSQG